MSTLRPTYLILTLLLSTCISLNTYTITNEPTGEIVWRSTTPFSPQIATSYGEIRIGQEMSIEFDFVYEGRTSTYLNQFFRIGAASDTQNCDGGDSKYPSMWLKFGGLSTAILDIQFTGDTTECAKNYLAYYGDLNVNAAHHILISLNETKALIKITGGDKAPYTNSWARDPTPQNVLGDNVSVWWSGDLFGAGDLDPGLGTFSNIVITTNLFTFAPTMAPTTTANPTLSPTHNPSASPTNPSTPSPSSNPSDSPSSTPTTSTPTQTPTSDTLTPSQSPFTPSPTTSPTTASPTNSPTTATPTQYPPTTAPTQYPSKYPTGSPVIDGIIQETSSTLPGDDYDGDGKTSDDISIDGTSMAIIVAVAVVSLCILCGVIILCKQHRQKNQMQTESAADSANYRKRNVVEMGVNDININTEEMYDGPDRNGPSSPYTPDGVIKVTRMGLAMADNGQEHYLSDAQKQALQKGTPGGPASDSPQAQILNDNLSEAQREHRYITARDGRGGASLASSDINELYENKNDYLSAAQRAEIEKNSHATTGGYDDDHKGDAIVGVQMDTNDEEYDDEMLTDDKHEFIIGSETRSSDEEVLDNLRVRTPQGNDDVNEVQIQLQLPVVDNGAYGKMASLSDVDEGKEEDGGHGHDEEGDGVDVDIEQEVTIGAMDDGMDDWVVGQGNDEQNEDGMDGNVAIDEVYGDEDGDIGGDDNFETIQ